MEGGECPKKGSCFIKHGPFEGGMFYKTWSIFFGGEFGGAWGSGYRHSWIFDFLIRSP